VGSVDLEAWRSVHIASDETLALAPLPAEQARELLADLLRLYREARQHPIKLFPRTAWSLLQSGTPRWSQARATWQPGAAASFAGEGDDPHVRLAWRGADTPLDAEFEAMAQRVFGPVLAARAAAMAVPP
jgi:exodeoxyribonuclease V gamma subunit